MQYLKTFTEYLRSGNGDLSIFSAKVKTDLTQTRQNLASDGIILDIEPSKVEEHVKDKGDKTIFSYQGSFIYGFNKNGIFHTEPGVMNTQTDRKANEQGEINFVVNKKNQKVIRIHETLSDNYWGEGDYRLISTITVIVIILLFLIFFSIPFWT